MYRGHDEVSYLLLVGGHDSPTLPPHPRVDGLLSRLYWPLLYNRSCRDNHYADDDDCWELSHRNECYFCCYFYYHNFTSQFPLTVCYPDHRFCNRDMTYLLWSVASSHCLAIFHSWKIAFIDQTVLLLDCRYGSIYVAYENVYQHCSILLRPLGYYENKISQFSQIYDGAQSNIWRRSVKSMKAPSQIPPVKILYIPHINRSK